MRHYLDHASTTPLRPAAAAAMAEALEKMSSPGGSGNPGRVHEEGRAVREAIESAREQLASLAGVPPRRVVFTSGATEAANTAVASALRGEAKEVICAKVEHSAVRLASAAHGLLVDLPVDKEARIDPGTLAQLLTEHPGVGLVNCQSANHEIGTLQPLSEVAELCERVGVPLHVDAAASFGHMAGATDERVSYTSISAHKLGGPPGIGALVLGPATRLKPFLVGGAEERGRRAGAEDVLGIVGFGAAASELARGLEEETRQTTSFRDGLIAAALRSEGVELLGPKANGERLPHIACFSIPGVFGEALLLSLDRVGIAVHSGSACASESLEASPVLEAMGADPDRSLRVSLGWCSSAGDVRAFAESFPEALRDLRSLAGKPAVS